MHCPGCCHLRSAAVKARAAWPGARRRLQPSIHTSTPPPDSPPRSSVLLPLPSSAPYGAAAYSTRPYCRPRGSTARAGGQGRRGRSAAEVGAGRLAHSVAQEHPVHGSHKLMADAQLKSLLPTKSNPNHIKGSLTSLFGDSLPHTTVRPVGTASLAAAPGLLAAAAAAWMEQVGDQGECTSVAGSIPLAGHTACTAVSARTCCRKGSTAGLASGPAPCAGLCLHVVLCRASGGN